MKLKIQNVVVPAALAAQISISSLKLAVGVATRAYERVHLLTGILDFKLIAGTESLK